MNGNCIKIHKSKGEFLRNALINLDAFDSSRKIEREGKYLYIPVKSNFDSDKIKDLEDTDSELVNRVCTERKKLIRSYRDILSAKLADEFVELLPRSFDTIGEIAVIKIPEPLVEYEEEIGNSIIAANKNIKTVFKNLGISGEYRQHELVHIAGENNPRTAHVEFGLRYELNIQSVYFSPRLATERYRIASLVKNGEVIFDMFAGVGPFSIMIAKKAEPSKIYALDINPEAVTYLKRNIALNSAEKIEAFAGDAKKTMKGLKHFGQFDRIIMNLPHSGYKFLPEAIEGVSNSGIIHYYEILQLSKLDERNLELTKLGENKDFKVEITDFRKIHSYSPTEVLTGFDIKIVKLMS